MKTLYLSGEIGWEVTADYVREQIDPNSKEKLQVILNTYGGEVGVGFEIYNILKAYKGEVEVIVGVMAASIGSYIAMCAPKEKRKAFKNSSFLMHEARSGIYEARARDMMIKAERLEGINNILAEAYAEGMGIDKEQSRALMNEDKYYTGWEQLVDNDIVSEIIDISEITIPQKEEDENGFLFFEMFAKESERPVNISVAREKMYAAEERAIKDIEKSEKDFAKAVAYLKPQKKQPEKQEQKPETQEPVNNNGGSMSKLQDFLKANPEAEKEYIESLNSAKGEGEKEMNIATAAIAEDRKRIAKILEMANGALTPEVAEALDKGIEPGEFAQAELIRQKKLQANAAESQGIFGALVSKQTPAEQGKEVLKDEATELAEFDKKCKEAAKRVTGKEV